MNAELIESYGSDLSAVNAARVSMDKESDWDFITDAYTILAEDGSDIVCSSTQKKLKANDAKLIAYLAANKHFSCFEHQGATLRLRVPLFVRSQIHRHRTFAYNEISRRYVKDNLEFYWPEVWRKAAENVKQGSSDRGVETDPQKYMQAALDHACSAFYWAIDSGVCPEQARMILPQNLYTQFYMTGNLRNWAHFLKLRLDPHAQKECRDIAQQCHDILKPLFPVSMEALMAAEC